MPSDVLAASVGESTVLMDCRSETYYTLNGVSSRIWTLLGSGAARDQILERLVGEYEVGHEQLDADVEITLSQLRAASLIAPGPERAARPSKLSPGDPAVRPVLEGRKVGVPSVLRCLFALLGIKVALRAWGFGKTVAWLRRRVEAIPRCSTVGHLTLQAAEHAVAMAGALYPGRALCLEQSLVLYYILRRQGVGVTYCQGVQPHPFQAHAWVEYQGRVINDVAEHVKVFARFPDVLP